MGRVVLSLARQLNAHDRRWQDIFFLDDFSPGRRLEGCRVESFERLAASGELADGLEVAIAVGDPAKREVLAQNIANRRIKTALLIHPDVRTPETCRIGGGSIIYQGAAISPGAIIEDNVFMQYHAVVGHDTVVGAHSVLSAQSFIAGGCQIGPRSYIGPAAAVRDRIRVGPDAVVAMGAAVFHDVPEGATALGNPAKNFPRIPGKPLF